MKPLEAAKSTAELLWLSSHLRQKHAATLPVSGAARRLLQLPVLLWGSVLSQTNRVWGDRCLLRLDLCEQTHFLCFLFHSVNPWSLSLPTSPSTVSINGGISKSESMYRSKNHHVSEADAEQAISNGQVGGVHLPDFMWKPRLCCCCLRIKILCSWRSCVCVRGVRVCVLGQRCVRGVSLCVGLQSEGAAPCWLGLLTGCTCKSSSLGHAQLSAHIVYAAIVRGGKMNTLLEPCECVVSHACCCGPQPCLCWSVGFKQHNVIEILCALSSPVCSYILHCTLFQVTQWHLSVHWLMGATLRQQDSHIRNSVGWPHSDGVSTLSNLNPLQLHLHLVAQLANHKHQTQPSSQQ